MSLSSDTGLEKMEPGVFAVFLSCTVVQVGHNHVMVAQSNAEYMLPLCGSGSCSKHALIDVMPTFDFQSTELLINDNSP